MLEGGRSMPNPPGAEKPPGGMGGGGIAAEAGGPAAGGCLNGTWTDITFASGSLHLHAPITCCLAPQASPRPNVHVYRAGAVVQINLRLGTVRTQSILPAAARDWRALPNAKAPVMTQATGSNTLLTQMEPKCRKHMPLAMCCTSFEVTKELAHQWEKKTSVFSISMLGTLKAMTSYGSAANSRNWYFRSHASFRCSKALMNRCRGRVPSSISGYSTCRQHRCVHPSTLMDCWFQGQYLLIMTVG